MRDWSEVKKAYPHPYDGDSYTVKLILEAIAEIEQLRQRLKDCEGAYESTVKAQAKCIEQLRYENRLLLELNEILRQEKAELVEAWNEMLFAYINKDVDCPHDFELKAVDKTKSLLAKLEGGEPNAKP